MPETYASCVTSRAGAVVGDRPLRVRVVGAFSVEGLDEKALGTRKARLLLKRLAVAGGRPVPSDELAAVLWPDRLPKRPADQVSVLVSRLRAVFGAERLPRSDAGYCLAAEAALAAGEVGAARAAAQSVLDGDPYDEAALRVIMRADASAGRPGAALAAYAAVRHHLSEDLGAAPAEETERLHTAIVRGELTTVDDAPVRPSPLVGRDGEIGLLDGLLARVSAGESLSVVIEAEAGMGKSALLSTWSSKAAHEALLIAGRCDELGGDLPLQPIVDGLAGYLDALGRDATDELVGTEAPVLNPLLGRGRPDALTRATVVPDMEAGKAVLFAALSAVLRRAAGDRPVVLMVADLHQAAPGTAEFLSFGARRIPNSLVVVSRRPEQGPDLSGAQKLILGPLSLEDAVALVGAERGRPCTSAAAAIRSSSMGATELESCHPS